MRMIDADALEAFVKTVPTCNLCGYAWLGVAKNTNYCPTAGHFAEDMKNEEQDGRERAGGGVDEHD